MHEPNEETMTFDDEIVKDIKKDDKDDGPSTSKRARLLSNDDATSSSYDDDTDHDFFERHAFNRSTGHQKRTLDDASDLDAPSCLATKVYQNVDSYLESIPEFDVREHRRIPFYMELLGDYANQIRTVLPRSENYSDERMEMVRKNFILSQLDFLIRENVRRTEREVPLASATRRPRNRKIE